MSSKHNNLVYIFGILVLVAFVCILFMIGTHIYDTSATSNEEHYAEAVELMESGEYVGAARILKDLGVFADSEDKYEYCLDQLEQIQRDHYAETEARGEVHG